MEDLTIEPEDKVHPILYYAMLNQGKKDGRETFHIAMDIEKVLTIKGERVVRISIVNYYGNIVFDTLI